MVRTVWVYASELQPGLSVTHSQFLSHMQSTRHVKQTVAGLSHSSSQAGVIFSSQEGQTAGFHSSHSQSAKPSVLNGQKRGMVPVLTSSLSSLGENSTSGARNQEAWPQTSDGVEVWGPQKRPGPMLPSSPSAQCYKEVVALKVGPHPQFQCTGNSILPE